MEKSTLPGTKESANRMVEATRTRLAYLDVSEEQIQHLAETGQVAENLTLYSPASGIVSEKMALEGMAVKPGMRLYTIADLSRVWVYVDIYEYQFPWVKLGQEARMTLPYTPGREFVGQVDYIYPTLDPRTRVNKVRLQFENPTLQLKPGMFANITLTSRLKRDALLIPREAYIDSGIRQVAFVDLGEGRFSPREIMAGVQAEDGMVEVLYGLDEGEIVVSSGQFLLDSEAKMQEAIAKMKPVVQIEPSGKDDHEHKGGAEQIPEGAKYSCPMDTHPDEENSEERGAYFSEEPGSCGICGMTLKPFEELDWVQALYAAGEADVRYTCVDHPHVLKFGTGDCPRCDKTLAPFKLMYTCPDPAHSGENSLHSGGCPTCGRTLAPYRGVWLDQSMAEKNVPPNPGVAEASAYRCPLHPLVHSDREGSCTICGAQLRSVTTMETQPLGGVANKGANYTCPMHPATVNAMSPGLCPVCGMQLVSQEVVRQREASSEHVALQMDNVMEHYLEIQKRLASDAKGGIALHALGLASAANELARHAADSEEEFSPEVTAAANRLHRAALKTGGINIQSDRVAFVELSEAVRTLVNYARPDRTRWPKLYIYHCPISKGDWLQVGEEKTNPYYGFKMLDCGDLVEIK